MIKQWYAYIFWVVLAIVSCFAMAELGRAKGPKSSTVIHQVEISGFIALTPELSPKLKEGDKLEVESGTAGGEIRNWLIDSSGHRIGEIKIVF